MYRYAFGYIGQGTSYNFMSAYFALFLTNCVGISSGLAGTISSLALVVEVFAGMVWGNLSDNCTSRLGRRRPFILASGITLPLILIGTLHTVEASPAVTFGYYLVFAILFRMFFACFEIPNGAFGSEISTGYDERTKQRTLCRLFSIAGSGIGTACPLLVINLFGNDPQMGWQAVGIMIALTVAVAWIGSFVLTKPFTTQFVRQTSVRRKNVLKEILINYIELIKLKPMKMLIVYKGAFACAFALYNIGTLYYLQYALGLGNVSSSYVFGFTIGIFFIVTPFINKLALHSGKANEQKYSMLLMGTIGLLIYFIAPNTTAGGVLFIGTFAVMQTGFWQLSNAIFFDVIEVDEYVNHKRRGGDIMSFVSVLGTLVTAIMVQLFGLFLELSGFDAELETQAASVVSFLDAGYLLAPSLCCLIGFLALKAFPINKKTFNSLQKALERRANGESYDEYMEDLDKLTK